MSIKQKLVENDLAIIVERTPAIITVYNIQTGEYTFVSDAIEHILGYSRKVILQKGTPYILSKVHPDDLKRIQEENNAVLTLANKEHNHHKDHIVKTFEYRIRHKNGTWRWLRTDGGVFDRDRNSKVLHVLNVSLDITDQKNAELADAASQKVSEQRKNLLEKISKGMVKSYNHQLTLEEIVCMLVPSMADYCRLALLDEAGEIKEIAVTHNDPSKIQLTKSLYENYIGKTKNTYGVKHILQTGTSELITKVDAKALEPIKNEPKLLDIIKSLNLQSYMGVPLMVRGKVIGAITLSSARTDLLYGPDDLIFMEEVARRIALMLDNVRLYRDALLEIEKRKEAEAVISESERQYRRLVESSPMPIAIHSMGKLLYLNDAAVRLIGAENREQVIGRNILDFVHPDYHELVKKRAEIIYKNQKPNTEIVEEKFIRLDGQQINVEVASLLFRYDGKPAIQVLIRDITQQKQIEEELREREERFRMLVQNSSDIINVFSSDGTITYQSPSVKKVLGRRPEDRIGKNIFDDEHIHPEDIQKRRHMLQKTFAKPHEMIKVEFRIQHANGSWRTIEAVFQNFLDDPRINGVIGNYRDISERKAIEEIIETERQKVTTILASTTEGIYGTDALGACTFINPALLQLIGYKEKECLGKSMHTLIHAKRVDGTPYPVEDCLVYTAMINGIPVRLSEETIWAKNGQAIQVLMSSSPLKEDEGIVGSVVTIIDIRDRKKLERQKDEFIGIASHELKTPVTSVKAYTQVLRNRFLKAGDEKSALLLSKMDTQLDKLTNLIRDLLDVTKIETGKMQFRKEHFNFNDLVTDIVEEMQRTTEQHRIIVRLGKTKTVYGDKDRIGQVLINFMSNAIKYSPEGGDTIVRTKAHRQSILASVQDFGVGIEKADHPKVFDRFFRVDAKDQASYPGLGLGLYISAEIVKRHNGTIWVESEKGKGATFSFSIPLE